MFFLLYQKQNSSYDLHLLSSAHAFNFGEVQNFAFCQSLTLILQNMFREQSFLKAHIMVFQI